MAEEAEAHKGPEDLDMELDPIGPITSGLLKAFADNKFVLDCPQITLTQKIEPKPEIIRGRGMIALFGDSNFQMRMYADSAPDGFRALAAMNQWVAGTLIPETDYFKLEATDVSGFTWGWDRVLIKRNGLDQPVITATLHALTHCSASDSSNASMRLYLFDKLDVAYNVLVKTTTETGVQITQQSSGFQAAKCEASEFSISVRQVPVDSGSTIIDVHSHGRKPLPHALEYRVLEALRYVTFRAVSWCIAEKRDGGVRQVTVMPRQSARPAGFDAPTPHDHPSYWADFWLLFSAYLMHIVSFQDSDHYHPLSAQLHPLISGETRELGVVALLVSVAVEGVLALEFEQLAKPSDTFAEAVDQAKRFIDRLECTSAELKARVRGTLDPMKQSRAKDKLKRLEELGVITKKMSDAWGALRNASAHAAVDPESFDTQRLWTLCLTVYTLLNLLVFLAVGYSGHYTDFSVPGWPVKKFDPPQAL